MRVLCIAIAAILVCLHAPTAPAAAEGAAIEPGEKWANVFSGAEMKFHYTVHTAQAIDGRLDWSLSVNRRTVEHGQLALAAAPGHAAEVTVAFKAPEVKEGVVLESQLSLAAYAAGDQRPVAQHAKTVWIFPRDPFAGRSQWLKGLKITLFDPGGKTADVLEKARVPFAFTKNTAALGDLRDGLLVIGEGTPWRDYRCAGRGGGQGGGPRRAGPLPGPRRGQSGPARRRGRRHASARQLDVAAERHHQGTGPALGRSGLAA